MATGMHCANRDVIIKLISAGLFPEALMGSWYNSYSERGSITFLPFPTIKSSN